MSRFSLISSQPVAVVVAAALAILAIAVLGLGHASATPVVADVVLSADFAACMAMFANARTTSRGTRQALFTALALAAAFGLIGRASWTIVEVWTGHAPRPPYVEAIAGIAVQICAMVGFAMALTRYRHRNWMRFEAMVDALLLIAAAVIVITQVSAYPSAGAAANAGPAMRLAALSWNVLGVANLILIVLLLVWRGEVLGTRLAAGLTGGAVALGAANFIYGREVLLGGVAVPRAVGVLWSLAVLCIAVTIHEPRRAAGAVDESVESPTYASDAARVRAFSIVVAILIATSSASMLAFRRGHSIALGIALTAFGVLLAMRAGHALWTHRRTTMVLEHAAIAEREIASLLEQRVDARTAELAEAHRVMQRMWTLGQQIALELTPERVLRRFIEAAMDVLRVDGGAVGLVSGDRVQVAITAGLEGASSLAGRSFPVSTSAMGRVVRTAAAWWTADAQQSAAEDDLPLADGARAVVVIPLQRRGECIGAIMLVARAPRSFTESELSHVEAMADLLSVALANADLLETLRKAEWRFRTLFRVAPDAVLTLFASGRIAEANDAVRDILGLYPAQVVGRTLEEFVTEEEIDRFRAELSKVLGGAPTRLELHLRHEAGIRVVALAARLLPETDPPMVLILGRDMTAEREMRARLAETERLAAVGELVAGVAHEVNNPLCTISAFAQLLQRDGAITADQRESVDIIASETMRASQVLRDLLTFARRSESDSAAIQVNELIERTMRLRSYEMSSLGIATEQTLANELPMVQGDPRQLQQVLLNLVTNAIQAMEPLGGGSLRVATRRHEDRVLIEVADTGPGIPAEARAHVFEPFFTTKRDGTGLGLSVSYGIVAAHGGSISIAHTGPGGTMFRVTLPATEDVEVREDAAPPARDASASPLSGIHMLFVDDELALHRGIRSYARRRGFRVITVPDGAAALDAARRSRFDVVVCDLRMSGIDGPAFYEVLRREHPALALRTLFITGDLVSASSRAFLESAGQPVLAKPFDLDRLEVSVASLLRDAPAAAV
ncbi:MAG TPA: ATP-binding protein [Gemmatimonadaceae bacterium]|nr:ATP-binding protein [Gemmatimonadaceae bacterium]